MSVEAFLDPLISGYEAALASAIRLSRDAHVKADATVGLGLVIHVSSASYDQACVLGLHQMLLTGNIINLTCR